MTSTWFNVAEKRLITVDEIEATGLTEKKIEERCIEGDCPEEYTYVKENTFLLYSDNEIYWTMTKVNENSAEAGNTNHYVYLINTSGSIDVHIVGYEPGGQWNEDGQAFNNYGIRPVITVSKKFLKH